MCQRSPPKKKGKYTKGYTPDACEFPDVYRTSIAAFRSLRSRHTETVVAVAVVHAIALSRGTGCPVKTRGRRNRQGGAAHVEPTPRGLRPGPADQISG